QSPGSKAKGKDASLIIDSSPSLLPSLVLPIRIFRMFQVPKRTTTAHGWNRREVVVRRRRRRRPFERPRVPWIVAGQFTLPDRAEKIDGEQKNGGGLKERSDRSDEIKGLPATARVVSENASRHAEQAGEVLGIKRHMEPDNQEPELPQSQLTIEHSADG